MNLIISIISYVMCFYYSKTSWKKESNPINAIAAILWMICGIMFTINFLAEIFLR